MRDRHFLKSTALLPIVMRSPWYTLYAGGRDSDLIATTSLTRASFELLLSKCFTNLNQVQASPADHHEFEIIIVSYLFCYILTVALRIGKRDVSCLG